MADAGQSSITVAVRVRPFTIREAAQLQKSDDSPVFLGDGSLAGVPAPKLHQRGLRSVIKVVDDRCLVFDPPEDSPVQRFSRSVVPTSKKVKDQVFAFDRVFDENTTQSDVYEGTTKSLLDSVLDGYNATVFAYGATGCGKTHTITGTAQHPGIIFLTMQELFEKIDERSQDKTTELSLSYLEIYNETIRDLLVPGGSPSGLMLREDSNQAVTVFGLSSHHPRNVEEVMDMIIQGNEYRTVSPTEANATSSRSHAVLQINVAQKDRNADVNEPHTMATLSIIDLAGSERASVTKNRGVRLTEGANINKSLLALGSCINALCDKRQRAHVPYRNSKLTRLLKFSLGGNCKTVMIVCVSPSSAHFDETQNTLRYANRAKNIQTKVTRNVFNVNRHVKDFLVKIDEQMALINELKAQQRDSEKMFYAKFRKQCDKRDSIAREGVQRLRAAYDHSAAERRERVEAMKKLKALERRIALLTGWLAAFDAVCERLRTEDVPMPQNLVVIRKTAHGVLAELENSRQHIHQKLDKVTWERAIDTALSHSLQQLQGLEGGGAAGTCEHATLTREAELLKANFGRESYQQVLEQDKLGDAVMMQMLLTAQFEMLASLSDILAMDAATAVTHAKEVIHKLLETGFQAASQVVKPDGGSLPVIELFPPTRKGTPKRKKSLSCYVRPIALPALAAVQSEHAFASPMKSPRRRKVFGAAKKGISFTPVKKSKKGGVRWRDDESVDGTLADFASTPQHMDTTPDHHHQQLSSSNTSNKSPIPPPTPAYLSEKKEQSEEGVVGVSRSSPTTKANASEPEEEEEEGNSTITTMAPSRFRAGFLSKSSRKSTQPQPHESPLQQMAPPVNRKLSYNSPQTGKVSPLRAMDASKASNLSSPSLPVPQSRLSPLQMKPVPTVVDENNAPSHGTGTPNSGSGSDSDSSLIDARKLRSAMQSAKFRRPSALGGPHKGSQGRRVSSVSCIPERIMPRTSMAGAALASSTNGISRARRGSLERRRSPPLTCSPDYKSDQSLTAGQARRMNLGSSSLRLETTSLSPRDRLRAAPRRVTINVGSTPAGQRRQEMKGNTSLR
ncbi:probable kinesin-related protein KIP3 [Claviceps purpurea 20.1]|uniref:Probable kinesin-related protein KIP3 n=1 Tax=Claviceps purpurea (strain 20.1) TaxID=1111077 RepID=M1W3V0_CLAP2|nr:probable kinesin-related protein KIP3 [Claviceps purpurea 20.1]